MKNTFNGFLCLCFLACSAAAQQPASAPQDDASQAAAAQQAPPQQQAPPATPPAAPPATPPAQDQQQQPAKPSGPTINTTPQLPKYPDVRLPGETGWYLGVFVWLPREQPTYNRGQAATFPQASLITLQGTPNSVDGLEFGVAAGLHNSIRASFFTTRAAGNLTSDHDLTLGSQTYSAGTLVSTDYKLQVVKLSFDYLTWPYPVESRKYRLHTLWQIQYVSMRTGFDAPLLPLVDSSGNLLIDANGNPVSYQTSQTHWFITPTLGANWTQYINKNVRLEINGSGFDIPHHFAVLDADASLNLRIGALELRGGVKGYYYKTSPASDFFVKNTMASVFFGARWYF